MGAKQQKLEIKLPAGYSAEERRAIGEAVVRLIQDRTAAGERPGGGSWSGEAVRYTQGYIDSSAFKIGGKSKSPVNLTLTGDMLADLQVLSSRSGAVIVGYRAGDSNDKAEGNILGTYGQPVPIPGKARPFLKVTAGEMSSILESFPKPGKQSQSDKERALLREAAAAIAGRIRTRV